MLDGRDDGGTAGQRGGKVAAVQETVGRRYLPDVEIAPYENDAAAGLSGQERQAGAPPGMQPHPFDLDRSGERLLTLRHAASPMNATTHRETPPAAHVP